MTNWITNRQPSPEDADSDGDVRIRYSPGSWLSKHVHWSYVGAGVPWRPPSKPAPEPPAAAPEPQPAWQTTNTQSRYLVQWPIARSNGLLHIDFDSCWHDSSPHGQDLIKLISEAPGSAPASPAPEPQPAPEPVASDRPALAVGQTWRKRDGQIATIVRNDNTDAWPFQTSNGDWYTINGFYLKEFYPHERDFVELISKAPEPAPVSSARRFVSISRTVNEDGCQTVDAIDDEGIAWWMVPGETGWQQLAALPAREVPAQQLQP